MRTVALLETLRAGLDQDLGDYSNYCLLVDVLPSRPTRPTEAHIADVARNRLRIEVG